MNHQEKDLLDDIEAWRRATVAGFQPNSACTLGYGRFENSAVLLSISDGKYSRQGVEPEMNAVMQEIREAVAKLEPARQQIIERKLHELRIAGMRKPGEV